MGWIETSAYIYGLVSLLFELSTFLSTLQKTQTLAARWHPNVRTYHSGSITTAVP